MATRVLGADTRRGVELLAERGEIAETPDSFKAALLGLARWERYAPGETITLAGDTDGDIFAVADGAVALTSTLGPADAQLAHVLHPGDWFGIVPLFTGAPRNGSTVARAHSLIARIPRGPLDTLLATWPDGWRHIGQLAAHYGDATLLACVDLMIPGSRRRALATVLRLAGCRRRTPPGCRREVLASQAEIAAIANLSRNSVNRILRKAEAAGWLVLGYNRIDLLDPDALRRSVDEAA